MDPKPNSIYIRGTKDPTLECLCPRFVWRFWFGVEGFSLYSRFGVGAAFSNEVALKGCSRIAEVPQKDVVEVLSFLELPNIRPNQRTIGIP